MNSLLNNNIKKHFQILQLQIISLLLSVLVTSKPYILLHTSQFKCFQTLVADETDLYIEYEIPDLVVLAEDDSIQQQKQQQQESKPDKPITTREEMMKYRESRKEDENADVMYNERQERNLNKASQIHKTASIKLKISEKEPHWHHYDDHPYANGPPLETELKKHTGHEKYTTKYDSIVETCFQSLTATSLNPIRIHVRISDMPPKHLRFHLQQRGLKSSMEILEYQIDSMNDEVQQILRDSDYLKDFERSVWKYSHELFAATVMWPCIRIAVLIVVMGIGSSIYLVQFFRRHGLVQ